MITRREAKGDSFENFNLPHSSYKLVEVALQDEILHLKPSVHFAVDHGSKYDGRTFHKNEVFHT